MEDLYANQEARLRFEAYRYDFCACRTVVTYQSFLSFERCLFLQSLASFSGGLWREPGHPRNCCHWRPGARTGIRISLHPILLATIKCENMLNWAQLMLLPMQSDGKSTLLEAFLGFRINVM